MLLDPPRPIYTAFMGDMPPGSVFAGHRIEAVAGRGGMGVVYRARQLSLDRVVALKVIAPALMADEAIRRRFLRESRVAASIDHPHVIPIYYTGEEDGVAFIAMRHVAGRRPADARAAARARSRPAGRRGSPGQVAAALDAAHASGLVHRDVKPANILLGQGEHAYLTDFGLTKHVLSEAGATKPGHWVGTLDFVAPGADPRRARGRALGRLRARLRPLLHARRAPAVHATTATRRSCGRTSRRRRRSVSDAAPGVPEAFDEVIARALAKDPEQRFQSAGDLGRAAAAAASGERAPGRGHRGGHGRRRPDRDRDPHGRHGARAAAGGPGPAPPLAPARRSRRPWRCWPRAPAAWLALADDPGGADGAGEAPDAQRIEARSRPRSAAARPSSLGGRGSHLDRPLPRRRRLTRSTPRRASATRAAPGDRPRPEGVRRPRSRPLGARLARRGELVHLDARTGRRIGDPVPLPGTASAVAATADAVYVAVTQPELDPGRPDPRDRPAARGDPPDDRRARRRAPPRARPRPAVAARQQPGGGHRDRPRATRATASRVRLNADHATDLAVGARLPVGDALRRRHSSRASASSGGGRPTSRRAAGRPGSRCARASCGSPTAPTSTLTRDRRPDRRAGREARSGCR